MTLVVFESVPIKESNEPLVDAAQFGFLLEPMYFKQGLSSEPRIFLRASVAKKIAQIQKWLKTCQVKLWDGHRSRDVQRKIYQAHWQQLKSQHPDWSNDQLARAVGTFVTSPDSNDRIPPHTTGGAVDLTLCDLQGIELNMGTPFDYFGPEASALYYEMNNLNKKIRSNRKLLREAMLAADFRGDTEEWWHFDYGNQLWAVALGKPFAIYGEVSVPTS